MISFFGRFNSGWRRCGFTLVDFLAVGSVVSVLLSLLLPAVQNARATARDETCRNRMKQVVLSLHNYHEVFGAFPPGWVSKRHRGMGHPSSGWQTMILPFLGQAPLYNRLNLVEPVYDIVATDSQLPKTAIPDFRCTSDSLGDTNPLRGDWGTSNFSGNYGARPIPRWSDSGFWPGQIPASFGYTGSRQSRPNGIFSVNSSTKIRDITDGTSSTICVGERSIIGRGGIWPGPRSNFFESDVVSDGSYSSGLNRSDNGFSSRHSGGFVYVGMCDGAVGRIHESVESLPVTSTIYVGGILQKLAGRNDDAPIGDLKTILQW